ncbi:sel1 repeat family protein [Moraxella atlantae]|uniref:sel1 repeat family protein n=1 Tax=Faucicola atlantae TaxID=34059 RepID=UPI0037525C80
MLQRFAPTLIAIACASLLAPLPAQAAKPRTTSSASKINAKKAAKIPPSSTAQGSEVVVNPVTSDDLVILSAEPGLTTISYPKANAVSWVGTDIAAQGLRNVAMPTLSLSEVTTVPTVIVPATTNANGTMLDVSVVDDFLAEASPKARHYPPVFANRTDRYNTTQRLKQLTGWIEPYAARPDASYEVLLRAAKLNAMGRNLDLGSNYAVRASNYVTRAMRLNDSAEANFLYGAMLAEGGGFQEGAKYLEKAERMGYKEATQSLAQADLLDDKRDSAIRRLNEFKAQNPNDPYIDAQLAIVNSGKYYIWEIPAATTQR